MGDQFYNFTKRLFHFRDETMEDGRVGVEIYMKEGNVPI